MDCLVLSLIYLLLLLFVFEISSALTSCMVNELSEIMSSNSKRQKLYGELNGSLRTSFRKRFEDRLTNLPCSLKTKISCLPTKDAVKTSILSKIWKRSWAYVTNLDFNYDLVMSHIDRDIVLSNCDYIDFVNRVLLLRDRTCLQRFRMKCYEYYRESVINTWITTALLCNVEELDLAFPVKDPILLPCDIFLCKTLVVLKLDTRGYVNMLASVCLPVLKTLHLSKVELSDDMSIVSLLTGCPVLEELRLRQCIGEDARVINIISSSLTSLTIDTLPCDSEELISDCNYQIVIDTPALKYLNITDYAAQGYVIKDLNHLIKADIKVGTPDEEDEFVGNLKPIADLFAGISQVQSLVLSCETMEAICSSDSLPTFNNLKYMKLGTMYGRGTAYNFALPAYLLKLLRNSLCLESLCLQLGNHYDYLSDRPTDVPPCFLSHLKVIRICDFIGFESEMKLVEYFLENGKVLEKVTIAYEIYDIEDGASFFKQLLMMTRSSAACKIEVQI